MIKITRDMRRMVTDPEFMAIVKAIVEVQDMVRHYEARTREARHQYHHDSAFKALVDNATAAENRTIQRAAALARAEADMKAKPKATKLVPVPYPPPVIKPEVDNTW